MSDDEGGDVGLGIPFNIASTALLTNIIAKMTDYKPGRIILNVGDAHIYENHIEGLKEQMKRKPLKLPSLEISNKPFWDLEFEDFTLLDYNHHPIIKFPVAV